MQGLFALLVLFSMQMAVAAIRRRSAMVEKLVDNRPRLIMWQGEMIDTQMRRAKITRADLIAKLREANVTSPGQIHAVVAETTGDVSVLHGHGDAALSSAILGDVIGIEPYRHLLKD
jgi:uncharacterized membrane protein YcaP (DUF421 family)